MPADQTLDRFLELIAPVRSTIKRLILFGSRARGDQKPYSDYDILVVADRVEPSLRKALYSAVVEILASSGDVVSLKIFREAEFQRLSSIPTPFMRNVLREGTPLG
jgi:uncharacterized protein